MVGEGEGLSEIIILNKTFFMKNALMHKWNELFIKTMYFYKFNEFMFRPTEILRNIYKSNLASIL